MFSIDTSALLDASLRYYPYDVFPGLWKNMDTAAQSQMIVAVDEVYREIQRNGDPFIKQWAKNNKNVFVPLDTNIQTEATVILAQYPRLVDTRKHRSMADPFVIALAKVKGWTVVTGEKNGSQQKPHIPDVCRGIGLSSINILQMFRQLGWQV